MYKSYIPYLQHILDECLYVRSVITDEMQTLRHLKRYPIIIQSRKCPVTEGCFLDLLFINFWSINGKLFGH